MQIRIDRETLSRALPAITFLVVLAPILLRVFPHLGAPQLLGEDGAYLFDFYFEHRELSGLLHRHALNYLPLAPNVLTSLAMLLPVPCVPKVMSLFPMLVTAAAFSLFSWRRFRVYLPSDLSRAAICVVVAVLPLGNFALLTVTVYSIFPGLVALLLLALAPLPARLPALLLQTACMVLAIASHPASILVAPILLIRLARATRTLDRILWGLLLATTVLYVLAGVSAAGADVEQLKAGFLGTIPFVLSRVVAEPTIGLAARLALPPLVVQLTGGVIALCLGAAWARKRNEFGRREQWFLVACLYVMAALSAFAIAGRGPGSVGAYDEWSQRYSFVQQVFFVLLAGIVVAKPLGGSAPAVRGWATVAILVALVALNRHAGDYYLHDPTAARAVAAFTRDLENQRLSSQPGGRIAGRLERGVWSIDIDMPVPAVGDRATLRP